MTDTADRIESIFAATVALANAEERAAYIDQACRGDAALKARAEALLRAHEQAGHLLDRPVPGSPQQTGAYIPNTQPGTVIAGRYKLLEAIGEGGMGAVWVAEQTQPVRRKVALKLIKPGMDSKSVLARFEAERQALAVMDHPNIAKVLDGGLTEWGRPYFVMEYVKGVPITEYCDSARLSVPERLNLFVQVCQAVQHAHQKGIIHRDLKPTNILVAPYDDTPVPKVIDFGLAKAMHQALTERTLHTAHETTLGTPLYMSPEQAHLNNLDVDTRSDIYSLGVLLYELLTGTTPLELERCKAAALEEIKRLVREEEPPRPSTRLSSSDTLASLAAGRQIEPARLTKLVRGELDWIVMKSLEKDRTRRYETANAFAADLLRYLRDETVEACPPSAAYRLRKFARRNRRALATGAIVIAALLAGTVVSTWQAIRATRATHAESLALAAAKESEAAAKESERVAIENAAKAQRQQGRADRYFLGARSVVDGITERLNDSRLLQIPEITDIRKHLLQDLLAFYQQMVQNESVDPAGAQDEAGALRMVGDIQHLLGNPVVSEEAYRQAIALREPYVAQHPDDQLSYQVLATCHANLGQLMEEKKRPDEAEAGYRRALILWAPLATDLTYKNPIYLASLAKFHERLFALLEYRGQNEAARAVCGQLLAPFEEAAAKAPQDVDVQIRLADALYWGGNLLKDTGRAEEGCKVHDRVISLYGKLPGTIPPSLDRGNISFRYLQKARLLEERKRWAEAGNAYRMAVEFTPSALSHGDIYDLVTGRDAEFRDPSVIIVLAKKALESHPKNYLLNYLGIAYYRTGDWKAAIAALEKSIELFSADSFDGFRLAMAKWHVGDKDGAREWYNKAVEGMPNYEPDAELIRFHSAAAELLGGPATLRKDLQLNPKDVNARLNLAYALWGERKLGEATDEFREAVRLDPGNAAARQKLAWALNIQAWSLVIDSDPAKRNSRRAVELAQEAVDLLPFPAKTDSSARQVAVSWTTLGVAQYLEGNWKDAIASLEKAYPLAMTDGEWRGNWFFLAMAHWQLGDKDQARVWYDKGVRGLNNQPFNNLTDKTLKRVHSEAAALLGVTDPQATNPAASGLDVNAPLNLPTPIAKQPVPGELPLIRPDAAVATATSLPATPPDAPEVRASDVPALLAHLGRAVTVEGRVSGVSFTVAHNALNVEFGGSEARTLMVWIPPNSFAKLAKEFGDKPDAFLMNRSIRVSGRLSEYGGRRAGWKDRLQITLDDPSQFSILPLDASLPTTQK